MSMTADALAQTLWPHVGAVIPKGGAPDPNPSVPIKNYAKGYVAMLQAGLVAHALPGSVAGAAPPGGPLTAGTASGGKIITLLAATMAAIAVTGVAPLAIPGLLLECTAIATYLTANALVTFPANTITGTSTATPPTPPPGAPGPLVAGAGSGGAISGLSGAPLAQLVTAATGQTGPKQIEFYTALVTYTMANAMVTYAANTVTGVCTPAGAFTLGIAAGGTVA